MKQQGIFLSIFNLIFFFCLQILVFRNVALFDFAFCFVYVGFILLLPAELPELLVIILAFAFGFCIDIFYDTVGIHMAACVFIAYIRPYVIKFLTPRGGYDANTDISLSYMGFQWFFTYAAILVFVHHLILFVIEAWSFGLFFRVLAKTILSSAFTLFVIMLFQYLFSPAKK